MNRGNIDRISRVIIFLIFIVLYAPVFIDNHSFGFAASFGKAIDFTEMLFRFDVKDLGKHNLHDLPLGTMPVPWKLREFNRTRYFSKKLVRTCVTLIICLLCYMFVKFIIFYVEYLREDTLRELCISNPYNR